MDDFYPPTVALLCGGLLWQFFGQWLIWLRMKIRFTVFLLLLLLAAIAVTDWPVVLRFRFDALNYWFVAALWFWVPLALLWCVLGMQGMWRKAGTALASMLAVACVIPAVVVIIAAPAPGESGFEILDTAVLDGDEYRLYQTNCGAPCSFGLLLNQERNLPLGLKQVQQLWVLKDEQQGALEVVDGELRVRVADDIGYRHRP